MSTYSESLRQIADELTIIIHKIRAMERALRPTASAQDGDPPVPDTPPPDPDPPVPGPGDPPIPDED